MDEKLLFSPMQADALGEMMNISLGSSATAVSNLLEHRVDITTPKVEAIRTADFVLGNLDPAMGVEIKYVEGLRGSNLMLLKRNDIKVIVDILMGGETPDEEFELNDLTISAVCEVMNQMMGAAATAMSDFLGYQVDISTPQPFELNDLEAFKKEHLPEGAEEIVIVRFALKIEGAIESEFMNVMSVDLAKVLLKGLGLDGSDIEEEAAPAPAPAPAAPAPTPEPEPAPVMAEASNRKLSQEEIEEMLAGVANGSIVLPPEAEPTPPAPEASSGKKMSQEEIESMMSGAAAAPQSVPQPAPQQTPPQQPGAAAAQMPQMPQMPPYPMPEGMNGGYPPMYYPYPYPYPPQGVPAPEPKVINTQPVQLKNLDPIEALGKEQAQNLDLIMEVPLQVTVEIGRTQRKVQDILEFSKGSLVVLDKLAGDQVDLFVNGKCVAKGDVVVIDDNFGVRITEIVQEPVIELVKK